MEEKMINLGEPQPFSLPDGTRFALDVSSVAFELEDIAAASRSAGEDRMGYLARARAYFQDHHGVALTVGQADDLCDHLSVLYAKKKQRHADAMRSLLKSPTSTESPPPT